ncbi:hypothetical protein OH77DRAFT_91551 [Trametes cingulata]|nr:hypothetical protein OH77DRAFT_91551 [Trametes cingulata]
MMLVSEVPLRGAEQAEFSTRDLESVEAPTSAIINEANAEPKPYSLTAAHLQPYTSTPSSHEHALPGPASQAHPSTLTSEHDMSIALGWYDTPEPDDSDRDKRDDRLALVLAGVPAAHASPNGSRPEEPEIRETRCISYDYDGTVAVYGQPPPGRGSTPSPKKAGEPGQDCPWPLPLPPTRQPSPPPRYEPPPSPASKPQHYQLPPRTQNAPPSPAITEPATARPPNSNSPEADPYYTSSSESDSAEPEQPKAEDSRGKKAAKAFGKGLLGLVGAPLAVAGVGVLAAGAAVWGAAKVVEGVGRAIAAGPEALAAAAGRAMEEEAGLDEESMRRDRERRERERRGRGRRGGGEPSPR